MGLGLSSVLSLTSSEQLCSGGLAKNLFIAVLTSRLTCLWETAGLLAVMPHPFPSHTPVQLAVGHRWRKDKLVWGDRARGSTVALCQQLVWQWGGIM